MNQDFCFNLCALRALVVKVLGSEVRTACQIRITNYNSLDLGRWMFGGSRQPQPAISKYFRPPIMPGPNRSSFLASFARKRDLWWQFTVRAVELRHRGSHLGIVWSVLNPLLMLGLYMFVFGVIFPNKFGVLPNETKLDFALALF